MALDGRMSREEELREIVRQAFGVVETTLQMHYRVPSEDAGRIEREVLEWFDRLSRRPGSPSSPELLRLQLVSMTCKIGHVYWVGKLGGNQPDDEYVRRTLALGPEIVAIEIEQHFGEHGTKARKE
jgi:hypothetical protein